MKSEAEIRKALDGVRACLVDEFFKSPGKMDGASHDAMVGAMALEWALGEPATVGLQVIMHRLFDSMVAAHDHVEADHG